MDIVLERILQLIPKKADGEYVHGAKKRFAETIGLKSGNLISDWINGRSASYKNYIYEISAKYDVPVEWLKGGEKMEVGSANRESSDYFYNPETRRNGKEYALARKILQTAAALEMQAWQVDGAFKLCKKLYKESADKLLVAVDDADNVFNFSI